jgi:hypothetical protein
MATILELVQPEPDWMGALGVALSRPPGVPERRAGDDPWRGGSDAERPRRISDDLAWFRQAVDEPEAYGLVPMDDTATVAAWTSDQEEMTGRLTRLRDRGVLAAAGFLLHDDEEIDFSEMASDAP